MLTKNALNLKDLLARSKNTFINRINKVQGIFSSNI